MKISHVVTAAAVAVAQVGISAATMAGGATCTGICGSCGSACLPMAAAILTGGVGLACWKKRKVAKGRPEEPDEGSPPG